MRTLAFVLLIALFVGVVVCQEAKPKKEEGAEGAAQPDTAWQDNVSRLMREKLKSPKKRSVGLEEDAGKSQPIERDRLYSSQGSQQRVKDKKQQLQGRDLDSSKIPKERRLPFIRTQEDIDEDVEPTMFLGTPFLGTPFLGTGMGMGMGMGFPFFGSTLGFPGFGLGFGLGSFGLGLGFPGVFW